MCGRRGLWGRACSWAGRGWGSGRPLREGADGAAAELPTPAPVVRRCMSKAFAMEVIEETHGYWVNLRSGRRSNTEELSLV